jgi:DNA invertase Pin-like site-specific DNA recombinase
MSCASAWRESGEIDTVVVYKVDRLSRSLMDFSKLVEVFDRRGAAFVAYYDIYGPADA